MERTAIKYDSKSINGDPKKWIKYGVLLVCGGVVVYQFLECFTKLQRPPITTHSHFDFNETVSFPAVTICRDPPYKLDVLEKYNMSYFPNSNNMWEHFQFDTVDLDEFFNEVTYNSEEYFSIVGLMRDEDHVKIVSNFHLNLGQCQTVVPLKMSSKTLKFNGYSFLLKHNWKVYNHTTHPTLYRPGWHIYLHEPKEKFSELNMEESGRVEYFYLRLGEEVEIKLSAQHYNQLPKFGEPCSADPNHSEIQCIERCQWSKIAETVGCTAPWMRPDTDKPYCNNYKNMDNLITHYNFLPPPQCICDQPCNSIIYSTFVVDRMEYLEYELSSQLWMYYTSKVISVYQERYNYGFPQFIADMGGSLGFLLGLSVLGLIGILQKIIVYFCGGFSEETGKPLKNSTLKGTKKDSVETNTSIITLPSDSFIGKQKY